MQGRNWKTHPITKEEFRAARERTRQESAQEWEEFRKHWPMEVLHMIRDIGAHVLLAWFFGMSLAFLMLEKHLGV